MGYLDINLRKLKKPLTIDKLGKQDCSYANESWIFLCCLKTSWNYGDKYAKY